MEAKVIEVYSKCNDLFGMSLYNEDNKTLREYDGYIPFDFLTNNTDGLSFKIDIESGKILNWNSDDIKNTISKFLEKTEKKKNKVITNYDENFEDVEDDDITEDDEYKEVNDTLTDEFLKEKFNKASTEVKKYKDIYPLDKFDFNTSKKVITIKYCRYHMDLPIQLLYCCLSLFENNIACNIKRTPEMSDIHVNENDYDKALNILKQKGVFDLNIKNINEFIINI